MIFLLHFFILRAFRRDLVDTLGRLVAQHRSTRHSNRRLADDEPTCTLLGCLGCLSLESSSKRPGTPTSMTKKQRLIGQSHSSTMNMSSTTKSLTLVAGLEANKLIPLDDDGFTQVHHHTYHHHHHNQRHHYNHHHRHHHTRHTPSMYYPERSSGELTSTVAAVAAKRSSSFASSCSNPTTTHSSYVSPLQQIQHRLLPPLPLVPPPQTVLSNDLQASTLGILYILL